MTDFSPSPVNLIHLIELQEGITFIARHDLGNSISSVRTDLDILQKHIKENEFNNDLSKKSLEKKVSLP